MLDILDITNGIRRQRFAVAGICGAEARQLLLMMVPLQLFNMLGMWIFDIRSTYLATVRFLAWGQDILGGIPVVAVAVLTVVITLVPTLGQMVYSRAGKFSGIDMAFVYTTLIFDAITDWPTAVSFTTMVIMPALEKVFSSDVVGLAFFPICGLVCFMGSVVFQVLFFTKLPAMLDLARQSRVETIQRGRLNA